MTSVLHFRKDYLSSVSKSIMIQASIQAEKGNRKGFELIVKDRLFDCEKALV